MMKSLQIFWKCYEYGDNLVNVFEFIDDQRSKSVRDITIPDPEVTEEFIDKHGSIVRSTFSLLEKIQQELFMLRCTRDPIQNFASPLSPMPLGHSIHTQNRAILTAPQLQLRSASFKNFFWPKRGEGVSPSFAEKLLFDQYLQSVCTCRVMENKKKTVEEFMQQGEKLMELPGSPKFLETHVNKLKEAWAVNTLSNCNHRTNSFAGGQRRSAEAEEWSGGQSGGLEELRGEATGLLADARHGGRRAQIPEEELQHGASTCRAAGESQSGSHHEVCHFILEPISTLDKMLLQI